MSKWVTMPDWLAASFAKEARTIITQNAIEIIRERRGRIYDSLLAGQHRVQSCEFRALKVAVGLTPAVFDEALNSAVFRGSRVVIPARLAEHPLTGPLLWKITVTAYPATILLNDRVSFVESQERVIFYRPSPPLISANWQVSESWGPNLELPPTEFYEAQLMGQSWTVPYPPDTTEILSSFNRRVAASVRAGEAWIAR